MTKSKIFIITLVAFILGIAISNSLVIQSSSRLVALYPLAALLVILIIWPDKIVRVLAGWGIALFLGFAYPIFLDRPQLIAFPFPALLHFLNNFKIAFLENINRALAEPFAALASGLVIGTNPQFPRELKNAFIATGTIHLVAVSGYNITIVLKIFSNSLKILGPRLAFYFGTLAIILFVILVGGQPSVVRASIMGWLFLLCWFLGRLPNILNALIFAAFLMILEEPKIITELSFQLSFASMIGLIFFDPMLRKIPIPNLPLPRWKIGVEMIKTIISFIPENFRAAFSATISAQLMTLPLIVMVFGRLSILAPLPNFLIVPLVPYAMILTIVIGALGFIFAPLAQLLAWPLWILLKYFLIVIEFFNHLKWTSINLPKWNLWFVLIYYFILFSIYWLYKSRQKLDEK